MVEVTDLTESELEKAGWERRSILDGSRLEEAVRMYEELGFEVLVREIDPADLKGVDDCINCFSSTLKVVYTRR